MTQIDFPEEKEQRHMEWEYLLGKAVLGSEGMDGSATRAKLLQAGQDGWELVSVVQLLAMNSEGQEVVMFFKRPANRASQ